MMTTQGREILGRLIFSTDTREIVGYEMKVKYGKRLVFCKACAKGDWLYEETRTPAVSDPADPLVCDSCGAELL